MKLELFDAYNIRARVSVIIILFSPIILALFLCFETVFSTLSSATILLILLAFTNYMPIFQRKHTSEKTEKTDYIAKYLSPEDNTIDAVSKERFYKRLVGLDATFTQLSQKEDPEAVQLCCKSASLFLREKTRGNRLVLEENINYGFCKNLINSKLLGIIVCILTCVGLLVYAQIKFSTLFSAPIRIWFTLFVTILILAFWVLCVTKKNRNDAAMRYAKAVIYAIDSL